MRHLTSCLLVLSILTSVAAAIAGDADDTVFLKNGGRARGMVLEEDPATGVRIRLPDATVKTFAAKDIDHVLYGARAQPPTPPPPTPLPVTPPPTAAMTLEGALHVETQQPATVSVDGGDYGEAPKDIDHLPIGRHRVVVHFREGGDVTRMVMVRGGASTPVMFETTAAMNAFHDKRGLHFGFGIEGGFLYTTEKDFLAGGRLVGRANYALSTGIELRADLTLGVFSGREHRADHAFTNLPCGSGSYGGTCTPLANGPSYNYDVDQGHRTAVPVALRFDVQFNLNSVYSMSLGVDLGVNMSTDKLVLNVTPYSGSGGSGGATTQQNLSQLDPLLMAGVHGSLLSFRFGAKREFLFNVQEGLLANVGASKFVALDQTFSITYLML